MEKIKAKDDVLWRQLWSLGALYASVVIGWIAYYNYQPQLLHAYNFNDLTLFLFISQGIILAIVPLFAGKLGDKFRQSAGQRLPIISAGISFAAMTFMAVAFTLVLEPGAIMRWIIPVLVVLWLASMALFTSPAISTVELFAPSDKLPKAMAILTIVYGLIYALEPIVVDLVEFLGAPLTFVTGGVLVTVSGLLLKKNTGKVIDVVKEAVDYKGKMKSDYSYSLFLGLAFGIITTVLFNLFPDWIEGKIGSDIHGDLVVSIVLASAALVSIPVSNVVQKQGLYLPVLMSIALCFIILFGVYYFNNAVMIVGLLIVFAIFYSMASVSLLPLALSVINHKNKVFGVGVFYCGFEIPNGIVEAFIVAQFGGL
ncbi:MAG: MFS transporter [Cyclobacteriaceae bacterium]